jgi:hypothetical protein
LDDGRKFHLIERVFLNTRRYGYNVAADNVIPSYLTFVLDLQEAKYKDVRRFSSKETLM